MTKNVLKFSDEKIFFYKNCNLHISRPPYRRPSYRRSLRPSKENIQHLKHEIYIFEGHFCPPGSGSVSRSTELIDSRSNPDPDPWSETLVFRLRTHLHDGEQVGEVLVHGGGDGDQLIVAWLHDGAAGQVTWRGAPAHQVLLSYLQSPYF